MMLSGVTPGPEVVNRRTEATIEQVAAGCVETARLAHQGNGAEPAAWIPHTTTGRLGIEQQRLTNQKTAQAT